MIVNELVTKFKFDVGNGFKNFDKQLQNEARMVDKTTKRMGRLFKALGKDIASGMKHRLKIEGTRAAQRDLERIGSVAGMLKSKIVALAAAAIGIGAITAAGRRLITVGMETETLFTKLANIRGPVQARQDMAQLSNLAAETPFKLNTLVDGFQRLNAAGFKVDINAMRSLGDIAAGSGKSIDQLTETMLSAARGQGSMVDNFNGMAAKAKNGKLEMSAFDSATGKTITTMVEAGDKAALLGFYLKAAARKDTQGSMEKLSQTMEGLGSTLSDNVDAAFRSFYQAGFGDALKSITKAAIGAAKAFKPLARNIGVVVGLKLKRWARDLPGLFDKIQSAAKFAGYALAALTAKAIGLRAVALYNFATQAAIGIASMGASGWAAAAGLTAARIAALGLQFAIGGAIIAIGLLAYDFYNYTQTGNSALITHAENWAGLGDEVRAVYDTTVSFGMGLKDLDGTMQWWSDNGSMYLQTLKNEYSIGFDAMKTTISNWLQVAQAKMDQFLLKGREIWPQFKEAAVIAMSAVKSAVLGPFNSLISILGRIPALAQQAFNGLLNAARNALANMPSFSGIMGGLKTAIGFNTGGMVPGGFGTRDTVPAMLTPGEVVVPVQAVKQIQAGNPAGFAKVAQLAQTKMAGASPQTYSMPASTVARGAGSSYATNINAPITQNYQISMGEGSPSAVAKAVTQRSAGSIRQELDFVARQAPRRVARA